MKFNIYYIDYYDGKLNLGAVDMPGIRHKNGEFVRFYNLSNALNHCAKMTASDKYGCTYRPSLRVAELEEYPSNESKTELISELLWEINHQQPSGSTCRNCAEMTASVGVNFCKCCGRALRKGV